MSDTAAIPSLDLREQITRIDRAIAETHKLQNESDKFAAEARKLRREYLLSPILAFVATLGGVLGVATFILHLMGRG